MTTQTSWQAEITSRAARDAEFKQRLLSNPIDAIAEVAGVRLPQGIKVLVHENDDHTFHLVLPRAQFPDSVDPKKFLAKLREEFAADTRGPCTTSVQGGTCW